MKFYINPPREIIPEFLGDFRPDAIALGPDGGMIIEVKFGRNADSERQLAAIAKKVSDQKGWEFRAIYLSPPADEASPIGKPAPEQLPAMFKEIEALTAGGHQAAGLVMAWAALEALARLASADEPTRRSGFSPIQAVQTLAEEGYIENESAAGLREMAKLRNAVVHGDLSVEVSQAQVEGLLKQLKEIASDIAGVS